MVLACGGPGRVPGRHADLGIQLAARPGPVPWPLGPVLPGVLRRDVGEHPPVDQGGGDPGALDPLCLDATILVIGFGAFFWFLIIRPAGVHTGDDALKQGLSEAYAGLDCVVLLVLGVRLLTGANRAAHSLAADHRIRHDVHCGHLLVDRQDGRYYAAGDLQDVFYLASYVPWAAAGRAQMLAGTQTPASGNTPDALSRTLPYATSLIVFLVLVYLARGDIGGPVAVMTTVVFTLTLLLMVRQGVVLRSDAVVREQRAARLVEDRFESLIANASDVIMIVEAKGVLRFVSPACERMLGLRPEEILGRSLLDVWTGPDCERLRSLLTEIDSAPVGTVGPVELTLIAAVAPRARMRGKQPHRRRRSSRPGAQLP